MKIYQNLKVNKLLKIALLRREGKLAKNGALVVKTGKYTGRSPDDRFIVEEKETQEEIDWGNVNKPITTRVFANLYKKILSYIAKKEEVFIFQGSVCANNNHSLPIEVITEFAWQNIFSNHLFRKAQKGVRNGERPLKILAVPGFKANKDDGLHSEAFIILNLKRRVILIGGTSYGGEIKKSVFSFLNFHLPRKNVFPMHCAANVGKNDDVALFFGLSGTGKTSLSADPKRYLIGDDEHGWEKEGIFNFEGGCYAKCINLKKENEPQIFAAIREGTVAENVILTSKGKLDFSDSSLTENTRAAYPLTYIPNSYPVGKAGHPKVVIFLTADAYGMIPPVAKLSLSQALYYFLSGYTSKLAGTERGVKEPKATFSAFFGAPFMPHKPHVYLNLLKYYLKTSKAQVYLINTGWVAGPYGLGYRIPIKLTREIVTAVLNESINKASFYQDPLFGFLIPKVIPKVPKEILNPSSLWKDKRAYRNQAKMLAFFFAQNFLKFNNLPTELRSAGPKN